MKKIHLIVLSSLVLSVASTFVVAGLKKEDIVNAKAVEAKHKKEAVVAINRQLIQNLHIESLGARMTRAVLLPDPFYYPEFTKTPGAGHHVGFTLMKRSRKEKKGTDVGTGYYDPATKLVLLFDPAQRIFVKAEKHPLVIAGKAAGKKRQVANLRKITELRRSKPQERKAPAKKKVSK